MKKSSINNIYPPKNKIIKVTRFNKIKNIIDIIGDFVCCLMLSKKIIKGTKWDYIVKTMGKNKTELFGIDEFEKTNLGSEWISHFCEILKSNNNKQKLYIPISDVEMKLGRPEYVGKLHDGLYFDKSSNSISKTWV